MPRPGCSICVAGLCAMVNYTTFRPPRREQAGDSGELGTCEVMKKITGRMSLSGLSRDDEDGTLGCDRQ